MLHDEDVSTLLMHSAGLQFKPRQRIALIPPRLQFAAAVFLAVVGVPLALLGYYFKRCTQ